MAEKNVAGQNVRQYFFRHLFSFLLQPLRAKLPRWRGKSTVVFFFVAMNSEDWEFESHNDCSGHVTVNPDFPLQHSYSEGHCLIENVLGCIKVSFPSCQHWQVCSLQDYPILYITLKERNKLDTINCPK